jgi:hypothetical protein
VFDIIIREVRENAEIGLFRQSLNISKITDIWSSCMVSVSIVGRHLHQQRALRLEVVQWLKNIVIESSWKNIIL